MEMIRVAGQHDDAAWRIRFYLVAIELTAQPDIEDAGHAV
jgi:hypothetical protein